MRLLTFLVALCIPPVAWGAEYWVDLAGTGAGAANGTNVSNLCAGPGDADCTPSAGDTVNLCNASTSQFAPGVDGTDGSAITYNWAPAGCTAASIETSSTSALNLGARQYLVMNDVGLTQTGTARCVNIAGADDITFNRGSIGPCAQSGTGAEGAVVFSPTVKSDRIVFNGTRVTNPNGNCIALVNATGSIDYADLQFLNMDIEDCGNAAGEHAIRLKTAAGAAATITRPLISGGSITMTYDYAIDLVGTDTTRTDKIIDPIITGVTIRDAGQIGPATGLGGGAIRLQNTLRAVVTGNDLDEQVGNGGGVVALYSSVLRIVNNDCSRMTNLSNQIDGGGIDIDHGNDDVVVTRNRCRDNLGNATAVNSGYGLLVLDSTNVKAFANDFRGNKIGISYNPQDSGGAGQDNEFYHNWLADNVRDGVHVNSDSNANNSDWWNNIITGNGRYGFSVGDADSGQVADYNLYWNNADENYSNQSAGSNDVLADPLLGVDGRPSVTSPACGAGTHIVGSRDYDDLPFPYPSPIGAFRCPGGDAPSPSLNLSFDGLFTLLLGLTGLLGLGHMMRQWRVA